MIFHVDILSPGSQFTSYSQCLHSQAGRFRTRYGCNVPWMEEQNQCNNLHVKNSTEMMGLRMSLSNAIRIADYGGEPALDSEGNNKFVRNSFHVTS